jgi:hypothetical protein
VLERLENRAYFSFSAPVSYQANTAPVAMISVDVNNDGRADLVSTNSGSAPGVTVLLGNGDGSFQAPSNTSLGLVSIGSGFTGSQAGTLTSGDFNGDGKVDLAAISSTNAIVLDGNGDGTFGAPITVSLGNSPARISTGDVNNDGRADLVAANTAGTVSVLLGNADGSFAPAASYAAGPATQDVKVVDMNHDGNNDLVVANAQSLGYVGVLLGNGDGSFQPYHSYYAFSAPYRMTVADFNGDGNMDVAVANSYTSSCITVLYGNADGTLQPYHSYDTGSQPWELDAKDVDGDGKPDLVSSNGSTYQIELNNGDGTFGASTSIAGAGLAFAEGDFNGDGVADLAGSGSGLNTIGIMLNNTVAATHVGTAVGFQVTVAGNAMAGASQAMTISAVDATGNVVTDFQGSLHITSSDPLAAATVYNFTPSDAGIHTFANGFTFYTAGNQTINVAGPATLTGSATVSVSAAATTRLGVIADAAAVAGSPASFTVSTKDSYGNATINYAGTLHFSSSDLQAALPADYTFTASDAGVHTFTAVLKTVGQKTISATDTLSTTTVGTSSLITVTPGAAISLNLIGGGGHIGSPHAVTVTALDVFGNVDTSYRGTVHLTSSNAQTSVSGDISLVNGIGTFSVTPMTLGTQTLTATSTAGAALTGNETIVGTPGVATKFVTSTMAGGTAGVAQNITVTAYDSFGNLAVDYAGTVAFSSSDYQATLPFYTFTAADAGVHTFSVTLRTAGTQSVSVRDYFNPTMSTTQTGIVVNSAAAVSMTVTPLHGVVAGTAQSFTVKANDAFGNSAASYRGTLKLGTSDTIAVLPATYTFTAVDAGTHVFSMTFKSSGGQTFTVQDTLTATMSILQKDIAVTPGVMTGFTLRAPSNATAGTAFSVTIAAVDAYGNTVTGYTGKVHFTGPSGGGNLLPADYTFTAADAGSHIFAVTLASTGTQTVNVADLLSPALKGSLSIAVKTATTSGGGGTGGGGSGGGGGGGGKILV